MLTYLSPTIIYYAVLELQTILSQWIHTTNETLAKQLVVFNKMKAADDNLLQSNINTDSIEDVFQAFLSKVSHSYLCMCENCCMPTVLLGRSMNFAINSAILAPLMLYKASKWDCQLR